MSDILATNVIASQPPEQKLTAKPNTHAKIYPKGTPFFNSNIYFMAKFHHSCSTHFFIRIQVIQSNLKVIFIFLVFSHRIFAVNS